MSTELWTSGRRRRPGWQLFGGLAGLAAALLLASVFAALTLYEQPLLRSVGWSPVARSEVEWPSLLELGRLGWLEIASFVVVGILGILFSTTLAAALSGRLARVGAVAIGVMSAGVGFMAFKPDAPAATGPESWHSAIHNGVYPLIPVSALVGCACLAIGLWRDPYWQKIARFSLAVLVICVAALGLTEVRAIAQLARYFFFGPLLIWIAVLALVLARSTSRRY